MKQVTLLRQGSSRLLLFFAGWACDPTPFQQYQPEGIDFMLCYDYRDLSFDASLLSSYSEVHVVGWSIGVWAASYVLPGLDVPILTSVAINGTPFIISPHYGIPPEVYDNMARKLNDKRLHLFLRDMCADTEVLRSFLEVSPRRPVSELREELMQVQHLSETLPQPEPAWTEAVVAREDVIVPGANQLNYWQDRAVVLRSLPGAHYQPELFRYYLQDRWINS